MVNAFALLLLVLALAGCVGLQHQQLRDFAALYWFASWTAQSLALPLTLLATGVAVWSVAAGAPRWPCFCIASAAACLHAWLHVRNHRMAGDLLATLRQSLPSSWQDVVPSKRIPRLAGLLPLRVRRADVQVLRDISYGLHGLRNQLDIYRPATPRAAPLPVLIQVHGGAWVIGNNRWQALPLMYHMAARGWLCVAINYRLGPVSRFPAMVTDVLQAIAWVRQHAAQYGGDPRFVALTGGSAGGHLSALAALVPNRPELQPGFEHADTRVDAVVPVYGRYDFLDRHDTWGPVAGALVDFKSRYVMPGSPEQHLEAWNLASPIAQVHSDAPPFFVLHGTHDCLIAVQECRHFVDALRAKATGDVVYAELKGAQHAFDLLHTPLTVAHVEAVEAFLNFQRTNRSSAGAAVAPVAERGATHFGAPA